MKIYRKLRKTLLIRIKIHTHHRNILQKTKRNIMYFKIVGIKYEGLVPPPTNLIINHVFYLSRIYTNIYKLFFAKTFSQAVMK